MAASYALDGALSHWSPVWFHAVNLVLHAGASAAAAALALAAGAPAWAALAGGLWFATLPAHVESVAWISGRTDVMCALLVGVTLLADARARARGRRGPPPAALAAFALALLAKETAVVALAVLALASIVRPHTRRATRESAPDRAAPAARAPAPARSRALGWLAPYAAIATAWLLAHLALTSHRPHPLETDPAHRARALWAAVTLLPRELAFALPWGGHSPGVLVRMPGSPWAPEVLGAALVHLAFLGAIVLLARRRAAAAVPLVLVWLALLPPAAAAAQGTVLFAERFLYLPSLGLAWGLALALGRLRAPGPARGAGVAAAGALVLAGGVVTIGLIPHWRSDETLFEHMAHAQPRSPLAHSNWAMMLAQQARDAEAVEQIAAAQALNPRLPEVYFARALLHYGRGRWDAAAASADTAVALDSLRLEPRVTRALARLRGGHADLAGPDLERLLVQAPGNPFVESAWGQCLLARGRAAQAIPYLARAARLIRNDPDVAYGLGRALGGDRPHALRGLARARHREPPDRRPGGPGPGARAGRRAAVRGGRPGRRAAPPPAGPRALTVWKPAVNLRNSRMETEFHRPPRAS